MPIFVGIIKEIIFWVFVAFVVAAAIELYITRLRKWGEHWIWFPSLLLFIAGYMAYLKLFN